MRYLCLICLVLAGCGKVEKIQLPEKIAPEEVFLEDVAGKRMRQVAIPIPAGVKDPFEGVDWTFTSRFSSEDVAIAQFCVRFVEDLAGANYPVDYNNLYWSEDMLESPEEGQLLGMTVFKERIPWTAWVGIASEMKPPSLHDLNAVRDFGMVLVHEAEHSRNLTIEPLVRIKINQTIDMAFDFQCQVYVTNFYDTTNNHFDFLVEKTAHGVGLRPPYHYTRDYIEPVSPLFRILMIRTNIVQTNILTTNIVSTNLNSTNQ